MRSTRAASSLSFADKRLAARAFVMLGVSRALVLTLPFARVERLLGRRQQEVSTERDELGRGTHASADAVRVGRIVRAVARRTPWDSNCLAQALTAKRLLDRQGVPGTVYIGAAFDGPDPTSRQLVAHAWLRSGPVAVTGGTGNEQRYGAIVSFA